MEYAGVALLFVLMIVVGLELTLEDFRRVADRPRAIVIATVGQVTLLPLAIGTMLALTDFSPILVGGALVVTVAPGAGASNLFTMLARANVALSVTLTAIGSLVAVVSIPLLLSIGFETLLGEAMEIELPVLSMIGQMVGFVLIPIAIGMWIRQRRPDLADRLRPILQRALIVGFVGIVVAAILFQRDDFEGVSGEFAPGLLLGALWTVVAASAGTLTGLAAGCRGGDLFAVVVEFTAKNGTVAALVAIGSLERLDLALFSAVYPIASYTPLGFAIWWHRRRMGALHPDDYS